MSYIRKPNLLLNAAIGLIVFISIHTPSMATLAEEAKSKIEVAGKPAAKILELMGAKLESEATLKEMDAYASHFNRFDKDKDGRHSKVEYIENGGYMTPQARTGIFNAADGNKDGFVTKAEYVLNRIITDEAKAIVQGMDDDKDGKVQQHEFVKNATEILSNGELAQQIFATLDADKNKEIIIPEYLRLWGQWARDGRKPAEDRIATARSKQDNPVHTPASLKERRELADKLEPQLQALTKRFKAKTFRTSDGQTIPYRLFTPQPSDSKKKVPLVVYLHGAGGRGKNNLKQISGGNLTGSRIWALPKNQKHNPCYILAPQLTQGVYSLRNITARGENTDSKQRAARVMALIQSVAKEFNIDKSRIYITGQSMGSMGTWAMLAHYPDVFAAAVPVCGAGDAKAAPAIVKGKTAIWVFHGDSDPTVPVAGSRKMAEALRAAKGQSKYTEYPGVKHDSWLDAYPDSALHKWMFEQKRER